MTFMSRSDLFRNNPNPWPGESQVIDATHAGNNQVMQYNLARASFPTNLVANALGFAPAKLVELEVENERQVPQVSF